jgi:hypothetical protein
LSTAQGADAAVGETLRVTADAAKIHIFDAKTDARLS